MPTPERLAIAERLRTVRLAAGLTQKDMASLIGCNQPDVCRYEAGVRECPYRRIRQWAVVCDVQPGYVFAALEELGNPF